MKQPPTRDLDDIAMETADSAGLLETSPAKPARDATEPAKGLANDDPARAETPGISEFGETAPAPEELPEPAHSPGSSDAAKHSGSTMAPGSRVSHYEVIRPIGRGGMGQVYLARDTRLGRLVALKFLLVTSAGLQQRFMAEARVTARFEHEHVVTLHEIGVHDDHPYMVLEYVEGRSLAEWLEERMARMAEQRTYAVGAARPTDDSDPPGRNQATGVSANQAAEIMLPVARALARSHELGIVHRDLKPSNIMLTSAGTIKVLDFGIAKILDSAAPEPSHDAEHPSYRPGQVEPGLTRTGALIGTLLYMSPEQWGADAIDERTDLWAVGLILHELVRGCHPLHPVTREKLATVRDLDAPMPRLSERHADLGPLATLVDRCLIKRKADRIASAEELATALARLSRPDRAIDVAGRESNPYAGLHAFQESDASRFFGRTQAVAQVVGLLADQPMVAVVGPSGVGKSSFVRAGVIPALKRSGESWAALIMRPGPRPLAAMAEMLDHVHVRTSTATRSAQDHDIAAAETLDTPEAFDTLAATGEQSVEARLRATPGILGVALRTHARHRFERLLVFIDQFEEIYTLAPEEDRRLFLACLEGIADDVTSPLRVVLSMRSDFLDRMAADPGPMSDRITRSLSLLPPMDRAGMRDALVRPLEPTGYRFESDELVGEMLDTLEHTTGALPLLQFAASRLWEIRIPERRVLGEQGYRRLGGIAGTLAQHADSVIGAMTESDAELARAILLRLVTPERTCALVTRSELRDAVGADPGDIERVLARLIDARLLTSEGSDASDEVDSLVEIVHESLIDQWPALARWLDEHAEHAEFLAKLRPAAAEWDRSERRDGFLWTDEAADEARTWYEHHRAEPRGRLSKREEAFLVAAIAFDQRSRRRRRRLRIGGVIALAVVTVVVSYLGLRAYQEAERVKAQNIVIQQREAEAQEEARRARNATRMAKAHEYRADPTTVLALLREAEPPTVPRGWHELAWQTLHDSVAEVVLHHDEAVWKARFSPDGTRIVTAGADGVVRIWSADGRGEPTLLRGHEDTVHSAAFSPDGQRIVTASADQTVRVWRADGTGQPTILRGHQGTILSAVFSPDGQRIATASYDRTARVWSADGSGQPVVLRGHTGIVSTAAFSPDGQRIITASDDRTARLWNANGESLARAFDEHEAEVSAAAFSPDGRHIVTGSVDSTIRVRRADGRGAPVVLRGHGGMVYAVAFSPDSQHVISASRDKTARIWRSDGIGQPLVFRGHSEHVYSAEFSPDGERILTASQDGTTRVWPAISEFQTSVLSADDNWMTTVMFSPDGARLASSSQSGTVHIWDIDDRRHVRTLSHSGPVRDVAFGPRGQRLVTASWDQHAYLWPGDPSGTPVMLAHPGSVAGVAFTPDGQHVVTACMDSKVRIWRAGFEEPAVVLSGHDAPAWSVSVSPAGDRIVSTSFDGTVRVWRVEALGEPPVVFAGHQDSVWSASFSPDGRRIVSASQDRTIQIWNTDGTGEPVVLTGHKEPIYRVAFSPDGGRIVSASQDQTVRIWNADGTGEPLVLRGHADGVNAAAFSPDGARVISASKDGTIRVWSDLDRVTLNDPRLWTTSWYCMSVERRRFLLDVDEERARLTLRRCLRRVSEANAMTR